MAIHVLLLGASGIPGRYILSSLLALMTRSKEFRLTVLKSSKSSSKIAASSDAVDVVYVDDYADTEKLTATFAALKPGIIVSALNAEPKPTLDNLVIDAVLRYQESERNGGSKILYISGYTLDLLHPSVKALPEMHRRSIQPKLDFANRLDGLVSNGKLEYCTIVNAAFLDYCLVKGYSAVDLNTKTATLVDGGTTPVTGCSLAFVGDVVALLVLRYASGGLRERAAIKNKRLRIAEAIYSGSDIQKVTEKWTKEAFEVKHDTSRDILERGQVVRYLNWAGTGVADFREDGFEFGRGEVTRRSLDEICEKALNDGVAAFEGIGR